jgi:hypothetical protein
VHRKFFPRDKNYVLEQAQLSLESSLLSYLADFVKVEYLLKNNPLGIDDDLSRKIKHHSSEDFRHLHEFYVMLMGIFRFEFYPDNQLTFIFEGKDAMEKYQAEWSCQFKRWTKEFCKHENFLRAVLDLTVFYPMESAVLLMDTRMHTFIHHFFDVRIHPQKGITRKNVA